MYNFGLLLKMIPLAIRLKKRMHREIARAQDIIIDEVYKVFNNAVLHGGTAIWRCYKGNRFSEDIDAYLPKEKEKINALFENLVKKRFILEKKRITEKSIYSNMKLDRTNVRFEATFKRINGVLKEYETADGNFITVYTLPPEDLIKEKANAYLNRLKIRDLYDIFLLLRHVKDKEIIKQVILLLVKNFMEPIDKNELKVLILDGIVPTPEKMIEYINRWVK